VWTKAEEHVVKIEKENYIERSVIEPIIIDFCDDDSDVSSLTSFNQKVVLFLATKPLTCTYINTIGLGSQCRTNYIERSVIEPIIIDFCDDDSDDDTG
jgi:hypothetical protein